MSRRLVVIPVVIAGMIAGYWYWSRPKPLSAVLWKVEQGRVEASVANTRAGTVKACRRSALAPAVGGQVSRLYVREGDRVKAGQVLLEIWNEDLSAQLNLALNELVSARAKADEACVRADVAEREAGRQMKLWERQLVAQEQMERAVADADAAKAACRAARASIQVAEAKVAAARAALERTQLKAPFDGVVAEVNAEQGEFATPSPTGIPTLPAIDLIDDTCLIVSAPIDEVDAPVIRVGMEAWVSVDAFPERRWPGKVRRVAPYVMEKEKQARTVEAEVELVNPKDWRELLAGYSADVEIVLDARGSVLRIPTEAVLEGYRVLVYRPADRRLEERKIEPGLSNWQFTEIKSGLRTGEQVVVSVGREGIRAGAYVAPEDAAPGRLRK
ncbi:MAG: efflux RND transporter periplasmic adaptor subunit [Deltaproteobacteria bacterium]|nr:efflux RND transporter periplasmic adaptor subunit [Deltaproteobacteria bacterium]